MVAVFLPFNCSNAGGKETPGDWLQPSRETSQRRSFSYNSQWLKNLLCGIQYLQAYLNPKPLSPAMSLITGLSTKENNNDVKAP